MQRECPVCCKPVLRADTTFCSLACSIKHRTGKPMPKRLRRIFKTCPVCEQTFECGGLAGSRARVCCSKRCAGIKRRGTVEEYFAREHLGRANYGWSITRKRILERDDYMCRFCGSREWRLAIHHMVPRCYGGTHEDDNLAATCNHCHPVLDYMIKIMKTKNPDFDIKVWLTSFMETF